MISESGRNIETQSRLAGFRFVVPAGALDVAAGAPFEAAFEVVRGPRGQ